MRDPFVAFPRFALVGTLALLLASCGAPPAPSAPQASTSGRIAALSLTNGDNWVSDLTSTSSSNGWGPVEKDMSNGGNLAGDGGPLTLNGVQYAKGLGTNAPSAVAYDLGARCSRFQASIGIDDEALTYGSVTFEVYADGVKVYDSGLMTWSTPTKNIDVDIAGAEKLELRVTTYDNDPNYDHGDWANAKVTGCITYSAPLTITSGGTYTGQWQSMNAGTAAVVIATDQPVVIENCVVSGRGRLFEANYTNARVTIRNCRGYGLNPNNSQRHAERFFQGAGVKSLLIQNNEIRKTSGIYVHEWFGSAAANETVKILRNRVRNIEGRYSNGSGGWSTSKVSAQFVQFDNVKNIAGAEIAWNEVINEPGRSAVEDNINMYVSSGTSASPILIFNNYVQGGYPVNPNTDSYSGGGILLGDGAGNAANNTVDPAYVTARYNQVVSTTNYGIAMASGHDLLATDNRVVSSGRLADNSLIAANNVGLYIWDVYNTNGTGPGTRFYNNVMRDNVSGWKQNQNGTLVDNATWFPNCPSGCTNNTDVSANATLSAEAQEFTTWQTKLSQNGIVVGP